jgi:hypothetical protein
MKKYIVSAEIIFSIIVIILIILPAFYVHPQLDDYSWPYVVKHTNSFFENQTLWYNQVNGRVFASFLSTILMSGWNFVLVYKLGVIIILGFFISSLIFTFCKILKIKFHLGLFISTLFGYYILLNLPQTSTFFYWLTGSIVYVLSFIFSSLFLLSSFQIYQKILCDEMIKNREKFLILFYGINAILFYELSFIFIFSLWGLIFILLLKIKKSNKFFVTTIIVFFSFFCLNIFAPGNTIKSEEYAVSENVHSLTFLMEGFYSILIGSLTITKIFSFFFVGFLIILFRLNINLSFTLFQNKSNLFLGLIIFNFSVPNILYMYKIGALTPERSQNFILSINTLLFIMFLFSLNISKIKIKKLKTIYISMLTCFLLICFLPNNVRFLLGDIKSKRFMRYDAQFQNRYLKLKTWNKKDVLINSLIEPPNSLFYYDLEIDSLGMNYFYNEQLADFYCKSHVYRIKNKVLN